MFNRIVQLFSLLLLNTILVACVAPLAPSGANVEAPPPTMATVPEEPTTAPAAPESETEQTAGNAVVGVIWLWQNQKEAGGKTVVEVPNPESFRLMLQPDGTFHFKADCNNGSGNYTLEGSQIRLLPGPMTTAACAADSLANTYLSLLSQMDTMAGDGDMMRLASSADGVNMNFTKFYAVTGRIIAPDGASLPQPVDIEIRVDDISIADAPAAQVGGQIISNATQFPVEFEATYSPAAIDERFSYGLTVRITDGEKKLRFINTQSYPVLTRGNPTYNIDVMVDPVGQ